MVRIVLVISFLLLAANTWASTPVMAPVESVQPAQAVYVPQPTYSAPIVTEVTPTGRNLSEMIRHSRPFNGLNPTLKPGESLVQLPYALSVPGMLWQQGTFKGGWYTGFLEKGDWVYAWEKQCPDRTDYTLSRGRCGNPAKPAYFKRMKYCPPPPPPPPPAPQVRLYTGEDTVLADVTVPSASFSHPAVAEQQPVAQTVGTIARVRNPGSESEHVLGGIGWSGGSRDTRPRPRGHRPSPPPPPPVSPYCPPTGGAPADPGGSQVFDTPVFVPGLSDQPISP